MVQPYTPKAKARIKTIADVENRMIISYNRDNVADCRIGSIQVARLQLDDADMKDPDKAIKAYLKPAHYTDALNRFNRANKKRLQTIKHNRRTKNKK